MANSRLITSDIWLDDWFGELDYFEQALWIGLFSKCADDQGRLPDNLTLLWAAVFPYKIVAPDEIERGLQAFAKAKRIHRYTARGKKLIQVAHWWDHQRLQWAAPSKYAPPPGWQDHVRTNRAGKLFTENWLQQGGNAKAHASWKPETAPTKIRTSPVTSEPADKRQARYIHINDSIPDSIPGAADTPDAIDILEQRFMALSRRKLPRISEPGSESAEHYTENWVLPLQNMLDQADGDVERVSVAMKEAVAILYEKKYSVASPHSIEATTMGILCAPRASPPTPVPRQLTPEEDAARTAAALASCSLFQAVDQSRWNGKTRKGIIQPTPE